jgi:hypothetical protein
MTHEEERRKRKFIWCSDGSEFGETYGNFINPYKLPGTYSLSKLGRCRSREVEMERRGAN